MIATIFRLIVQYRIGLCAGLFQTFSLCLIVWINGLVFGILGGALAHRYPKGFGVLLKTMSFFLASIPILVVLFWLHYPLQEMLGVVIHPFITAAIALTLVNTVSTSQLIRDVLNDFPTQYSVAGKVCGLTDKEIFFKIQIPIIFRQVIPQILTQQVNMLQMTLFASLISVEEIFRIAQRINSIEYKPIEIYTALALFFIAVCLPLNGLAYWLKNRYTRTMSEK